MRSVPRKRRMLLAALGGGALAGGTWWFFNRERRPYGPLWIVEAMPRPTLSRRRLLEVLAPAPGERVLEIGPGYGYYSLPVARRLGSAGQLWLVDIRRALLDETTRRLNRHGRGNFVARQADATALPFEDGTFPAAFLVACLGEVGDGARAVRELARVLEPGGRLVVGESVGDPHRVDPETLAGWARDAGLRGDGRIGRKSYFARFRRPAGAPGSM